MVRTPLDTSNKPVQAMIYHEVVWPKEQNAYLNKARAGAVGTRRAPNSQQILLVSRERSGKMPFMIVADRTHKQP